MDDQPLPYLSTSLLLRLYMKREHRNKNRKPTEKKGIIWIYYMEFLLVISFEWPHQSYIWRSHHERFESIWYQPLTSYRSPLVLIFLWNDMLVILDTTQATLFIISKHHFSNTSFIVFVINGYWSEVWSISLIVS